MNVLSGLTGLRAIAAILVVVYHLNQHFPTNWLGYYGMGMHKFIEHFSIMVSVFFMLSGFFRSLSYWKCIDTPNSMPKFFISLKERFFRIAPTYYMILVVSIILVYFISGRDNINFPAFFTGFTFLNWVSPNTLFPVLLNGPLWFVWLDMMGWIFTSLFMMGLLKIKNIYIIPYFISIWLLFLSLHFLWKALPWIPGQWISYVWFPTYNPFIFFLHFIFGIGASGIVTWLWTKKQESSIVFDIWYILTLLLTVIFLWTIREQNDWALSIPNSPYHFPWITIMIGLILICLPFTKYIGKILDNTISKFTAKLSYSIFLIHGVVMAFLLNYVFIWALNYLSWIWLSISTIVLSYILSWITYTYIELPCSISKKK